MANVQARRSARTVIEFITTLVALVTSTGMTESTLADEIYINEIFFNAPSKTNLFKTDPDLTHQYVELRGTADMSLANHYLVFVENESAAGTIEAIFDLGSQTLGSNGFLTISQKANANANFADYAYNPAANNIRNTGAGAGFGNAMPGGSTVGFSGQDASGASTGILEASGFTAFLIRTDGQPASTPVLLADVDVDNNGLDMPMQADGTGVMPGWTVLDSISLFAEENEALLGRAYAPVAFGFEPANLVSGLEPGAQYVYLEWPELEAEYIGRFGDSTGNTPEDWLVANLTVDERAGFQNMGDFRMSAEPHESANPADWENNHGIPYGTAVTVTVGGPNYPANPPDPIAGDFDEDGEVDADDLNVEWRTRFGVDLEGQDYLVWQQNFGAGVAAAAQAESGMAAIPEPSSAILTVVGLMSLQPIGRRRSHSAA